MKKELVEHLEIPDQVEVSIDNKIIKLKGPAGEVKRELTEPRIKITKEGKKLKFEVEGVTRKYKGILYTHVAHLKNMIKGAKEKYTYRLKICSGHFPMNVTADKNKVTIKNFLGEKVPRYADIVDNVSVKVENDIIVVQSSDKEKAGLVSTNIERATKIPNKDRRVFQDGIFLIEKAGEPVK